MVVIYLLLISFFLFAYYGGYINSEQLFIGLNIIFSLYIGLLICKQLKKGMSIINPIIVTSIFMFLLPYGFPVLFQYSNGEIRYYPTYISLFSVNVQVILFNVALILFAEIDQSADRHVGV